MKYLFAFVLMMASSAFAETSKVEIKPEVQRAVRDLLSSGGKLNASDFGTVPEVQVVTAYKIISSSTAASVTTVRVDLTIVAVKTYDEATHRYRESKLSKARSEQIVIELKSEGKETSLVHPIGSYSLR